MSFHPIMPYGEGHHRSDRVLLHKGEPFTYTAERAAQLEEICAKYPPEQRKSAILYALYLVQDQQGYISRASMRFVAQQIGCTPAEVEDVVSYYVMFHRTPVGKFVLQVCTTLSCALAGAERVTETLSEKLGIKIGETDASGMFTLLEFECLGACDRAPVVMVNNEHWHEKATPESCSRLVDDLKSKGISVLSGCHLQVER